MVLVDKGSRNFAFTVGGWASVSGGWLCNADAMAGSVVAPQSLGSDVLTRVDPSGLSAGVAVFQKPAQRRTHPPARRVPASRKPRTTRRPGDRTRQRPTRGARILHAARTSSDPPAVPHGGVSRVVRVAKIAGTHRVRSRASQTDDPACRYWSRTPVRAPVTRSAICCRASAAAHVGSF